MTQLNEQPMTKAQEIQIARKALKPNPFVTANLFTAENVAVMTPESRAAHQAYFEELMLAAAENRDYDSLEVLKKAVQVIKTSFVVADVPRGTIESEETQEPAAPPAPAQGVDPHIPDSPGDGPGLPDEPPAEDGPETAAPDPPVDPEVAEQLQKAMDVLAKFGVEPQMLATAVDADLLQLKGIGQGRLKLIRQAYPKANA